MLLTNQAAPGPFALLQPLLMFALVGGFFYFMLIKPQKKQQEQFRSTLDNLQVGDKIVTRGGIKGQVVEIKSDSLIINTAGSNIEILKQALSHVDNSTSTETNSVINKAPVGNLDYGKDKRFLDKLSELKERNTSIEEYDLMLEDVFEYVVVEDSAQVDSIVDKFRLPRDRAEVIISQLEELGIVSRDLISAKREILIDPR